MFANLKSSFLLALPLIVAGSVAAQNLTSGWTPPAGAKVDRVYFKSNLGSFKLIDGIGKATFAFSGTAMLSQVKGTVVTSGKLRKEYDKGGRVAYFGTGRITVTGNWRGIQMFGKRIDGEWFGAGIARFYGEFDDKLNTGTFWFDSDTEPKYWSPYGSSIVLPMPNYGATGTPMERPKPKKP